MPFLLGLLVTVLAFAWLLFVPARYVELEVLLLILILVAAILVYANRRTYYRKLKFMDPDNELMRELEELAPGTYHHSLQIFALALHAARQFTEIDLLDLKLGCFLHDIGKLKRAEYFTENQFADKDKFDDKHLERSREIILSHSKDGIEMAKKYRVPKDIWQFIETHHGTSLTGFYYKLKEQEAALEEENYRYPGPKPKTLAAAILMLADSCEAAARSRQDQDFEQIIGEVLAEKENDGQLEEVSDLTVEKLEKIKESFLEVLNYIYHKRVKRADQNK